jgi:phosphoribosylformylglycinamidine synthase
MAELLSLRGRNALSPFRLTKLLSNLAGTRISGITADFWHFVGVERELTAAERATLERILTYGPLERGRRRRRTLRTIARSRASSASSVASRIA